MCEEEARAINKDLEMMLVHTHHIYIFTCIGIGIVLLQYSS